MGAHHHNHQEASSRAGRAFRWSIALNTGLTTLQLAIGFGFGSLALIGDALHNLGDVIGLVLGWGADHLSRRPASGRFTYGYGRRCDPSVVRDRGAPAPHHRSAHREAIPLDQRWIAPWLEQRR